MLTPLFAALALAPLAALGATVELTDDTIIRGTAIAPGITAYLGIPFAEPPVGPLRFRAPVPLTGGGPLAGQTINATAFGSTCAQDARTGGLIGSEDCLTLNVFAPDSAHQQQLPVLVWIYGGAFVSGASSDPTYNPVNLMTAVPRAFIFVSINYRLGPFGFWTNDDAIGESASGSAGMQGILDQIAALAWVRDNIASFGGDPRRITIEGESAGSMSVSILVASPLSRGLFSAAMMQSGTCDIIQPDQKIAVETCDGVAKAAGCDTQATAAERLACLRARSASELIEDARKSGALTAFSPNQFSPTVDGYVLPRRCIEMFQSGDYAREINVLLGSNNNEMTLFIVQNPAWLSVTKDTYPALLQEATGGDAALNAHYSPANFGGDPREALIRLLSEKVFICSMRRLAAIFAADGGAGRTYLYSFNHAPKKGLLSALPWAGAFHFADVPYFMGNAPTVGESPLIGAPDAEETTLMHRMMRFLAAFAISGNPSAPVPRSTAAGAPDLGPAQLFPEHTVAGALNLNLQTGDTLQTEANRYAAACDLWDRAPISNLGTYVAPAVRPVPGASPGTNAGGDGGGASSSSVALALGFGISAAVLAVVAIAVAWFRGGARQASPERSKLIASGAPSSGASNV
jgi:para-nitrobenzyl esterase